MPISNYPNGFASGVTIRNVPLAVTHPGKAFWVDSTSSLVGKGTYERPYATLAAALAQCTANKGDIVFIKPGHSETITGAGGLTISVAGVAVVGLGSGSLRPTFLMDGAATVTAVVSAANVTLHNLLFKAGHADIVAGIVVGAKDVHLDSLEFVENVATENFLTEVKVTSTVDNAADGLKITNCRAISVDAAALEFLEINGDLDRLVFCDNFICKDGSTSNTGIVFAAGKDGTNVLIKGNMAKGSATANQTFLLSDTTANTGIVAYNLIGAADTAGATPIDFTGAALFENYQISVDDASALLLPAVDDNA